jgi:hypothetical protein
MNARCKVHFLCRCLVGHFTPNPWSWHFAKWAPTAAINVLTFRPATPYPPGQDPRNDMCLRMPNGCHLGQGLGHFSSKLTLNPPVMPVPGQLAVPGQFSDTYLPISWPRQNFRHIQSFLRIPSCDPILYRYPKNPSAPFRDTYHRLTHQGISKQCSPHQRLTHQGTSMLTCTCT